MNRLFHLLRANAKAPGRLPLRAEASDSEATVYLYDAIVSDDEIAALFGGVSPTAFAALLSGIKANTIHLRINSPGGSVFAGRAIEQTIRDHPARVIAHVDGYAASAASYVALACDRVIMAPGAFLMIHKSWSLAFGNADDFTHTAGILSKIDDSIVRTYAERTGQPDDQIRQWLAAETWFNAEEAVTYGFAHSVAEDGKKRPGVDKENLAKARGWDLSAYANAPQVADTIDELAVAPALADGDRPEAYHGGYEHSKRRLALCQALSGAAGSRTSNNQ